jgi:bifunctional non-homologous end joining protein LigD
VQWRNQSRVIPAPGFIEPCLPTLWPKPPAGPLWLHEIKHDGYRLLIRRDGKRVRIYTRRGADWTKRFPLIVEAALRLQASSFFLDGEGVVCCPKTGVPLFDLLHDKTNDDRAFLYGFDLVELNGDDLREQPLEARKKQLAKLLRKSRQGIVFNEHLVGDSDAIYRHACKLNLEWIVSKRRDMGYRSGRVKSWLKVKNPKSPAALRIEDGSF